MSNRLKTKCPGCGAPLIATRTDRTSDVESYRYTYGCRIDLICEDGCEVQVVNKSRVVPLLGEALASFDTRKLPSERLSTRFVERLYAEPKPGLSDLASTASVNAVLKAVGDVLDERLGRPR